jgi:predicted PurR-regulated permease PerM
MAMGSIQRRTHFFVQLAFVAVALWGVVVILQQLQALVSALGGAFVLAYLLNPPVAALEKRGLSHALAIVAVLSAVILVFAGALGIVAPLIFDELDRFVVDMPGRFEQAQGTLESALGRPLPKVATDWWDLAADRLSAEDISGLLANVGGGLGSLFNLLAILVLTPIFTVYLLIDFQRVARFLVSLIPSWGRSSVTQILREIDHAVARWLRGELVVMLTLSTLYSVGLTLVGVPLAVVIGFTAGMLAFIPYVGVTLGLVLGLVITLVDFQGWSQVLGLLAVFGVVQTLDGLFITPNVLGGQVGLNPVAVIAGLIVGGTLLGFGGILLAVPLTAAVVVIGRHVVASYRSSRFYRVPPTASDSMVAPIVDPHGADPPVKPVPRAVADDD